MAKLQDRVALITGGARGQGASEGRLFVAEGATVVLADVLDEEGERTAAEAGAEYAHLDVASEEGWDAVVADVVARHGRLDVLVNNAGILRASQLVNQSLEEWNLVVAINQTGVFLGMRAAARAMVAAGNGGSIVNIASVAATIAFPGIGIYSGTKSAVERMTKVAAMEAGKLGYGVRVNCIFPGLVPTAMGAGLANDVAELGLFASPEAAVGAVVELTPAGRLGAVDDMADAVVFLASDASRFVTGAGLPVDGGMGM